MKDYTVSVRKLTDEDLMREACESTFIGTSHVSLETIYKSEHSPVRTQLFWITLKNIPLFISTHLIRHHVGSIPFQLTCRDDRKGGNPGLPAKIADIRTRLSNLISDWAKGGSFIGPHAAEASSISEELDWLANNSDRYTPVNLSVLVNAQSLIDMSKLRLCTGTVHRETVQVFQSIKQEISKIDPALASVMVRKCVYRNGLCGEQRCCGFNHTSAFVQELQDYASHFTEKQRGLLNLPKE